MLADRIDKRWLFTAVAACNLAFLLVLLSAPGFVPLMVACCVIGLAIGGTYPLWMTLTADCFGSTSFGAVMGTMNFVVMPFSIASIRFIGEVFDRTGRYDLAFQVFIGTAFLATALIWRASPTGAHSFPPADCPHRRMTRPAIRGTIPTRSSSASSRRAPPPSSVADTRVTCPASQTC